MEVTCSECSKGFSKSPSQMRSPKGNNFCSRSCSVSFNNKNKEVGLRRSKFEIWIEQRISETFPTLEVSYNKKDTIGSELDIYIPSLKLAFEIQGTAHYEVIWSEDVLRGKQDMDNKKREACKKLDIELVEVDISHIRDFKRSLKFVNAVEQVINKIHAKSKIVY